MKSALIASDFSSEAEAARRRVASVANEIGLGGVLEMAKCDVLVVPEPVS